MISETLLPNEKGSGVVTRCEEKIILIDTSEIERVHKVV